MSATRIPFDLESPFTVASTELTYGGRRFGRGDAFPWRELGVEPLDLVRMWTFLQLDVARAEVIISRPEGEAMIDAAIGPPTGEDRRFVRDGRGFVEVPVEAVNPGSESRRTRRARG